LKAADGDLLFLDVAVEGASRVTWAGSSWASAAEVETMEASAWRTRT
jgi:hypothetical protein